MRKNKILTGLAGAAALAGASQAYGTVIVRNVPANIIGHDPATGTSAQTTRNIDVDGNGTADLQIRYRSFTTSGFQLQQVFSFSNTGQTAAYGPYGAYNQYYNYPLAAGTPIIDPGGPYAFGQSATYLTQCITNVDGADYGIWMTGQRAFLGFSFMSGAQLDFGFLELQFDAWGGAGNPGGVQFFSMAYEDSGGQILAGAPEPSTLAALAFGGAGLAAAAYRRRKNS